MIIFDVNVFLFAMDQAAHHHSLASKALVRALTGTETVGLIDETLTATVRISTNPALQHHAAPLPQAVFFCERVRSARVAQRVQSSGAAWPRFTGLVSSLGLRGNDITDAWLAAQAMELDAHFVTFDRGFQRFPGLRLTVLG